MNPNLKPAVSRHHLYVLAGLLWTIAGLILCYRSLVWLSSFSFASELGLEILSALAATGLYATFFSAIVRKNIERIGRLPDQVCVFAFTPWKGYGVIAFMMLLGIGLRSSDIPKIYLAVPFSIMGMTLLIGSVTFFRRFFTQAFPH